MKSTDTVSKKKKNIKSFPTTGLIVVAGLLLIVGVLVVFSVNQRKISCLEAANQSNTGGKTKTHNIEQMKRTYEQIKLRAASCKDESKESLNENSLKNRLKLLTFYYKVAASSYSFGDYNEAKNYADKTLSLNEGITDSQRTTNVAKASVIKQEMEAIKNGTY